MAGFDFFFLLFLGYHDCAAMDMDGSSHLERTDPTDPTPETAGHEPETAGSQWQTTKPASRRFFSLVFGCSRLGLVLELLSS